MTTTVPASVTSLESLLAFLEAHRQEIRDESLDVTALPTFGGSAVDEPGVYSWDAERLLVDAGGTWEIVSRRTVEQVAQDDARAAIRQGASAPWGDGVVLDGDGRRQVAKALGRDLTDDDVRLYVRAFVATIDAEGQP